MSSLISYLQNKLIEGVPQSSSKPFELRYSNQPFCPRKMFLLKRKPPISEVCHQSLTMHCILELGHIIHSALQSIFSAANSDDFEFLGLITPSDIYEEFEFVADPCNGFNASGHADGLIKWQGKYYVLEIKTIRSGRFDKLESPKHYHKVQANCYGTRFTKMGFKIEGLFFIYVNREAILNFFDRNTVNYFKFFEINYQPQYCEMYERLLTYAISMDSCDQIPLGICNNHKEMINCSECSDCEKYGIPYLNKSEEAKGFRNFIYDLYPPEDTSLLSGKLRFLNGASKHI